MTKYISNTKNKVNGETVTTRNIQQHGATRSKLESNLLSYIRADRCWLNWRKMPYTDFPGERTKCPFRDNL